MKSLSKKNIKAFELSLAVMLLVTILSATFNFPNIPRVVAEVMSSQNYSIEADSVNFGGGQSNSSSYRLEDTAGEVATGDSSSATYNLKAGYQQMTTTYIAMTSASDVSMSPALGGITGGTSNGSAATTVTTDSPAGYGLYIKASSSPAMQGNTQGDTIANYVPAGAVPDFTFSVDAGNAEFGFSPEGADVADEYLNNGSNICSAGSTETVDSCWNAVTTSNELIAERTSGNHPSGTATTIKFRLTIGSGANKTEDDYTATTTLTAIAL